MTDTLSMFPHDPDPVRRVRMLIVDDAPGILESLAAIFESQGYDVLTAATGQAAVLLARECGFDVALVDYMLPDVSGMDVLQQLNRFCPESSCIIMTAYASVENVMAALNLRARGFVLKPLDIPSVLMKVGEVLSVQKLERENRELFETLRIAYPELEATYKREHRISEMLQRALLPSLPPRVSCFEVGGSYQVGLQEAQVGGDIYDIFQAGDDRISILIADVSGKGIIAAVQMGMVHYSTRALAFAFSDPGEVVRQLNRVTCSDTDFTGFVTLFYGVFDRPGGVLRYVNAGHEMPLLHRAESGSVQSLPTTGPVVGISAFPEDSFGVGEVSLSPGDTLLLFTDGLSELSVLQNGLVTRSSCPRKRQLQSWLTWRTISATARSMMIWQFFWFDTRQMAEAASPESRSRCSSL